MGEQWFWIVRLLGVFMLVPLRLSADVSIVRCGRLFTTATALVWISLWLVFIIWSTDQQGFIDCFRDVIVTTMSVYNVSVVIPVISILFFTSNVFCLTRLYCRDLVSIINRSLDLYAKAAQDMGVQSFGLSYSLKAFIIFVFLSCFVVLNVIIIACDSGGSIPWSKILYNSISCMLGLPSSGMATVFFVLLYTIEESLNLIHKQLLILYASKTPRPFLESTRSPPPGTTSRATLTSHRLHSLRMIHYDLIEFTEYVMKQFQSDILFLFVSSFCQNVMFIYSIVFNHRRMFHDLKTFYFICHSLFLDLVNCLWMTCAGPNRIREKKGDLMNSTARLSTILNQPSDIEFEIRIFQLQVRNHKPSFEIFGMFELSFSLLFKMCASIVSYIVVLIQFAVPPTELDYSQAN